MLISDGAVDDYEPVFEKYNWPDRKVTFLGDVDGRGDRAHKASSCQACQVQTSCSISPTSKFRQHVPGQSSRVLVTLGMEGSWETAESDTPESGVES